MKKQILLFVCLLLASVSSWASVTVNGINYDLNSSDKTASVANGSYSGSITIPSTISYNGMTFSVTGIGKSAFWYCSGLTSVTIPNSVTSIGEYAFNKCTGLTSITIPNSVTSIGEKAFWICSGLTSITIPNGVFSIGNYAFADCSGLTSVYIPKSVTSIGTRAFGGTGIVGTNTTPNNLTSIVIEDGNSVYDSRENCNAIIETASNTLLLGCNETIIPNGVSSINYYAFGCCRGLTSIVIPEGVTSIGEGAFFASTINSISIPKSLKSIGKQAFYDCSVKKVILSDIATWCNITFEDSWSRPNGMLYCDPETEIKDLVIPDGVTSIGSYLFGAQKGLTSVSIPNSVTSIGERAFLGCTGLTSVASEIESPFSFGSSAFYNISSLCVLTVPAGTRDSYIEKGWTTNVFSGGIIDLSDPSTIYVDKGCCFQAKTIEDIDMTFCVLDATRNTVAVGVNSLSIKSNTTGGVTIPEKVSFGGKEYSVTSINNNAFYGCSSLTSVTIPNSVTSIGDKAFSGCSGLTSVTIGRGVTSVGSNVFSGCTNISSLDLNCRSIGNWFSDSKAKINTVVLGSNVTNVDTEAFSGCSNITSVTINCGTIGNWFADSKSKIKTVVLGEGITYVAESAFENWSAMTSITLPKSLKSVGNNAFRGCTKLTEVNISDLNAFLRISFGWYAPLFYAHHLYLNGEEVTGEIVFPSDITSVSNVIFEGWYGITSVVIPEGVSGIGQAAFKGCTNLESVTLPSTLKTINAEAFQNCGKLRAVAMPKSVTSIGDNAFDNCTGLKKVIVSDIAAWCNIVFGHYQSNPLNYSHALYSDSETLIKDLVIPAGVTKVGDQAFIYCSSLESITIPEGVKSIGWGAILGCTGLTSITIPNTVTVIGSNALNGCSGLTSLSLGSGVTSIGGSAFSGCTNITSLDLNCKNIGKWFSDIKASVKTVVLGDSVTSIGASAFSGFTGLTTIAIPKGVTSIGNDAFNNCSNLEKVIVPDLAAWCNITFGNAQSNPLYYAHSLYSDSETEIKDMMIPEGVTSLRFGVFFNCSGLTEVAIPNSVTSIGDYAFSGCSGLTSITIPNSVTSIDNHAFDGCTNITSLDLNCKNIGKWFSDSKASVKTVVLGDGVTSIGKDAFSGCSNITSLDLNCKNIGNWFSDSKASVKSVVLGDNVTSIGANAFSDFTGLTSIAIPKGVTSIGNDAFSGCSNLKKVIVPDLAAWCSITFGNAMANPLYYTHSLYSDSETEIKDLVIPDGVTSIGNYAFENCFGLTSVTFPGNVTSVGNSVFSGCTNITALDLNCKNVGNWFGDIKENVKTVALGDNVTSIGANAFSGFTGLSSIAIPKGVTSIGNDAFNNCSNLEKVIVPDLAAWCSITFGNAQSNPLYYAQSLYSDSETEIKDLVIPESVTSMGDYAFYDCSGLTSITIPNSVTSVGSSAFSGCTNITALDLNCKNINNWFSSSKAKVETLTLGDNVESIGQNVFKDFTALKRIKIGSGLTSMGDGAFSGCNSITSLDLSCANINNWFGDSKATVESIILGENVTAIGDDAFNGFTGIKTIDIPNAVTNIGASAFEGNTGVTRINLGSGLKNIAAKAFAGCDKLEDVYCLAVRYPAVTADAFEGSYVDFVTLHVPSKSVNQYKNHEVWGKFMDVVSIADDPVTITAVDVTREYGDENPEFTFTFEGASFEGTPEIVCEATSTSPVGTYPIVVSKGSVNNNNVTFVVGTLTITKAPLTISAGNYVKEQFEEMPEMTLTYTGFKNNETEAVLTVQPTVSCEASADTAPGEYEVVVSGAEADNYVITYVNGKLTVTESTAISDIEGNNKSYDVYNIQGNLVRRNANSLKGLSRGMYIINGKKIIIR